MLKGPQIATDFCVKCENPMLVARTDGVPLCHECEKEVMEKGKAYSLRKQPDGWFSLNGMRYVPAK